MHINEVKDLLNQFDKSSLREFSYSTNEFNLAFSKNSGQLSPSKSSTTVSEREFVEVPLAPASSVSPVASDAPASPELVVVEEALEGEAVKSPLVGVAYLKPAPDKDDFISVGDKVKKGQTLLIIEAMKVMNEIPAPCDGVVTEILVASEEMVEFGEDLVRIK
ncbi:acetyl-CoA carboxylase biotin carboxyl carrier protein [Streptococcaceae bacterium ESL0729]|nr:acetyl-CoA carboxylase biotin carboxyl carrier protein [Streptococcaceae bacterium ESL0729]